MIDKTRVTTKIMLMEGNLTKLEQLGTLSLDHFLEDFRNVESAKHLLQVTIECMIDICEHITAKKRLGIPENAADSIRFVYRSGFVPTDRLDVYLAMTRFRNRVVHLYHDVDDAEIHRILMTHLQDFRCFISDILSGFGI